MPHKYGRPRYNRKRLGKPRRDKGKRHKHSVEYNEKIAERNKPIIVETSVYIPKQKHTLTKYVMMYNWYCRAFEYYKDRELSMYSVQKRFKVTQKTVYQAVQACKVLQAERLRREAETHF